jgi:L-ornithine Nalpha-acyltransferase
MEIREGKYSLKLALSPADKQQTFCLRHRVFCDELNFSGNNEEFQANAEEFDAYDKLCDHLLVRDENWDCCVATLRFLPGERLSAGSGFYSEQWFDIGQLNEQRSRVLELGRACIDAAYRNTVVFRLLFAGVGAYLRMMPHDYLIGLTTLPAEARVSLPDISAYLHRNDAIYNNFGIQPKKRSDLQSEKFAATAISEIGQRQALKQMSTLMLAYYKYGAKFVGEPSVDVAFDPPVFDYFTIFDAHQFPAWAMLGKHPA